MARKTNTRKRRVKRILRQASHIFDQPLTTRLSLLQMCTAMQLLGQVPVH